MTMRSDEPDEVFARTWRILGDRLMAEHDWTSGSGGEMVGDRVRVGCVVRCDPVRRSRWRNSLGAALFRRRPNQSLRRWRGRRQLDPSTRGRGEEAAKGTGVRRYLCRQRPLGVSAGTRALRGKFQYASKRRLPVAA